ncbi:MAG: ABC transporter permease [Pseudomonadota bacterium]|nr:ABC transporter permease [Pseudomonadota bacterium]
MDIFSDSYNIFIEFNEKFIGIVFLSLYISILATIIATAVSLYICSLLIIKNFIGKNFILLIINSLMSLPPVVVGLVLYIIFSYSGVLGFLEILYTPTIMILAQIIIIVPIIISLSYTSLLIKYNDLDEYLVSINTSNMKKIFTIIRECKFELMIIIVTGLGRALSEVGAVIIVGGNIANMTRVMTTSIVLETSRGELALALSLGITLISFAIIINLLIYLIKKRYL